MPARFINDGIGKSPSQARRVRTKDGIHISGNLVLNGLKILQHAASRPVDICPFLENDIDKGTAKIGKTPDRLYLRRSKKGG